MLRAIRNLQRDFERVARSSPVWHFWLNVAGAVSVVLASLRILLAVVVLLLLVSSPVSAHAPESHYWDVIFDDVVPAGTYVSIPPSYYFDMVRISCYSDVVYTGGSPYSYADFGSDLDGVHINAESMQCFAPPDNVVGYEFGLWDCSPCSGVWAVLNDTAPGNDIHVEIAISYHSGDTPTPVPTEVAFFTATPPLAPTGTPLPVEVITDHSDPLSSTRPVDIAILGVMLFLGLPLVVIQALQFIRTKV